MFTADIWGYQESPVLPTGDPNFLPGTRHPYFAPDLFAYTEARIEWTHWRSRDYFAHANQCWYSLQYGVGLDTDLNHYQTFRALFQYDVKCWLSIGAEAKATPVAGVRRGVRHGLRHLPAAGRELTGHGRPLTRCRTPTVCSRSPS